MSKLIGHRTLFIKLLTIIAVVILNGGPFPVFGSENSIYIRVLNKTLALEATYTTTELDDPAYFPLNWFYEGRILNAKQAKEVLKIGGTVCNLWTTIFSDERFHLDPDAIKNRTLDLVRIPIWKNVSGRLIFLDPTTDSALSYNCIKSDSKGNPIETSDLSLEELNIVFKSVIEINEEPHIH